MTATVDLPGTTADNDRWIERETTTDSRRLAYVACPFEDGHA
ncbi:hypothetical protein ACPPVS_11250 [Cellulomonas sp. McL0617]